MNAAVRNSEASVRERLARIIVIYEAAATLDLPIRPPALERLADLAILARAALRVRDGAATAYLRLLDPAMSVVERVIALDLLHNALSAAGGRGRVEDAIALFGWDWRMLERRAAEAAALEARSANVDTRAAALADDDDVVVFARLKAQPIDDPGRADPGAQP